MFRPMSVAAALLFAAPLASAADSPQPAADTPAPLPEKNGARLAIGKGTGTTREDALKAAYANAVKSVAGTLVAQEREVDTQTDKVVRSLNLDAANGIISEVKEIEVREVAPGQWRATIQAKIVPLKLTAELEKAKVPLRKAEIDGEGDFARITSRQKAAKDAAAWFHYLLKDNPYGCFKAEVLTTKDLPEKSDEKRVTYAVTVRLSIDFAAYDRIAAALAASLEHLSLRPSGAFEYEYHCWEWNNTTQSPRLIKGTDPERIPGSLGDDVTKEFEKRQIAFVALVTKATPVTVDADRNYGPGHGYRVSGRYFILDRAVATAFENAYKVRFGTRVRFNDADGKMVAERLDGQQYYGHTPLSLFGGRGSDTFFVMPTCRSGGGWSYNHVKPVHDEVILISLPLNDVRQIKTSTAEVVALPK
jgi:hypothetical protein